MNWQKKFSWFLVVMIILSSTLGIGFADQNTKSIEIQTLQQINDMNQEIRVIIELKDAPVIQMAIDQGVTYNDLSENIILQEKEKILSKQDMIIDTLCESGIRIQTDRRFTTVVNGFSSTIKASDFVNIKSNPNVKSIQVIQKYYLPTSDDSNNVEKASAPKGLAWGYKGEGKVVAVIDSGADFQHKDFLISTGTAIALKKSDVTDFLMSKSLNAEKLAKQQSGIDLTADMCYKSEKIPFAYDYADRDTDVKSSISHGQHVTGIVAANGTVKGVAPEAQVLALKVFSDKDGSTYSDILVQAMEDAIQLKADVINVSIGAPAGFTLSDDMEQQAIKKAREAGIVVVIAAGNYGRYETFSRYSVDPDVGVIGSPASAAEAFTVASVKPGTIYTNHILQTADGSRYYYESLYNEVLTNVTPYNPVPYLDGGIKGAEELKLMDFHNKIALLEVSGNINERAKIVVEQGAIAVVFYNSIDMGDTVRSWGVIIDKPVAFVGSTCGNKLKNSIDKTIFFPAISDFLANPNVNNMSRTSSWGPTPNLEFKPEITAPGDQIYSTLNDNLYGASSGTSMAAPHVSAAMALMMERIQSHEKMKELNPREKAILAKNILMSTAKPLDLDDVSALGIPFSASPRQQGAGVLNIEAALKTEAYAYSIEPGKSEKASKVTLREIKGKHATFDVTVQNLSTSDQMYLVTGNAQMERLINHSNGERITGENQSMDGDVQDIPNAKLIVKGSAYTKSCEIQASFDSKREVVLSNTSPESFDLINSNLTTSGKTGLALIVPSDQEVTLSITLDLTNSRIDATQLLNDPALISKTDLGFFAEGFINFMALNKENPVDLSIPYLGYNGNWNEPSILDGSCYESKRIHDYGGTVLLQINSQEDLYSDNVSGLVVKDGKEIYDGSLSCFSPNGDKKKDLLGVKLVFLRNAKALNVFIEDSNGVNLGYISKGDYQYVRKNVPIGKVISPYFAIPATFFNNLVWDGTVNGKPVADGQYQYVVETTVDYPDATPQTLKMPVFVDTTAPEIKEVSEKSINGNKTLTIDIVENHRLKQVNIYNSTGKRLKQLELDTIHSFDLRSLNVDKITVEAIDFSDNKSMKSNMSLVETKKEETKKEETKPSGGMGGFGGAAGGSGDKSKPESFRVVNQRFVKSKVENSVAKITVSGAAILEAARYAPEVVIEVPKMLNSEEVEFSVLTDVMELLSSKDKKLTLKTENVSLSIPKGFADIRNSSDIIIRIKPLSGEKIQSNQLKSTGIMYDFEILKDKKSIESFENAPEMIFTLSKEISKPESIGVYVQDASQNWNFVMTYYNPKSKTLSVKAPHFSKYALLRYEKSFEDVKGTWAQEIVEQMAALHITKGITDELFAPNKNVTRAEFIAWILRALGEDAEGTTYPSDVKGNAWYAPTLSKAMKIGLIEGGRFRPDDDITREEMAKYVTIGLSKLRGEEPKLPLSSSAFTDVSSHSENAKYIYYLADLKIVNGYVDKTFKPTNKAVRSEAMAMIRNMLNARWIEETEDQ